MKAHQEKINALRKYFLTQIKKINFPRGIDPKAKEEIIGYYGTCLKYYPDAIPLIETLLFSNELKINWVLLREKHKWSEKDVLIFFTSIPYIIDNWYHLDKRTETEKVSKIKEIFKTAKKLNNLLYNLDDPQIFIGGYHSSDPLNKRAVKLGIQTSQQNDTYKKLFMNLSGGLLFLINRSEEILQKSKVKLMPNNYYPVVPSKKTKTKDQESIQFRNFLIRELYLNCQSIFDSRPRKTASAIALIVNEFSNFQAKESYIRSLIAEIKKSNINVSIKKPKKIRK